MKKYWRGSGRTGIFYKQ